ncbi:MAG: orotidine-5'-phosphate decarboxylase [Lentisphaeraceae bacterium]|nr:orotidine-5'-phosphate decarboxylase [Lentisphaeraceae bacterium]
MSNTQLIVALDVDSVAQAEALVDQIGPEVVWYKIGKQLFTREGVAALQMLKSKKKKIFLDLKFHDIPNTVAQAVKSALSIGADMVNFHAFGGSEMIRKTVELNAQEHPDALLIAVTVLTSMDQTALAELGVAGTPAEVVKRFAGMAKSNGAHGVVCSALEIDIVKEACGKDFQLIVPGIRPAGSSVDDQKRIMTPTQAAEKGADYIVVGRPITKADDKRAAAAAILEELK